jgi:hypothetical protein
MKKIIDFITFVMAIAFVGSLVLVGKELLTDNSIYLSLLGLIFIVVSLGILAFLIAHHFSKVNNY